MENNNLYIQYLEKTIKALVEENNRLKNFKESIKDVSKKMDNCLREFLFSKNIVALKQRLRSIYDELELLQGE